MDMASTAILSLSIKSTDYSEALAQSIHGLTVDVYGCIKPGRHSEKDL